MKKLFYYGIICLLSGFLLTSCGTRFSLEKRHYNKGFYFSHGNTNHSTTGAENTDEVVNDEVPVETDVQTTPGSDLKQEPVTQQSTDGEVALNSVEDKTFTATSHEKNLKKAILKKMENKSDYFRTQINSTYPSDTSVNKEADHDHGGDARSLLWLIVVVLLILWAIGFLLGGLGLGWVIHLLAVIAVILLILWLLRLL